MGLSIADSKCLNYALEICAGSEATRQLATTLALRLTGNEQCRHSFLA